MKGRFRLSSRWAVPGMLLLLLAVTQAVQAHESRMVGPYQFVVGFVTEPAIEGEKNGVDLRVNRGEGDDAVPVEGLEETLEVEVTHVASGISEVMALRPVFQQAGHYTNDWIPTAPGQYRFRFVGSVEEMAVDEVFESGPDTFGAVEAASELYFPEAAPEMREMEGAVRGAQSAADEALSVALAAEERSGTLQTLVVVAIVLATVASAVSVGALVSARRR